MNFYKNNGMNPHDYQEEFETKKFDNIYTNKDGKMLFAAAPGAGKTVVSISCIERFLRDNPGARVLVLAHNQNILKDQYFKELKKYKVSFTYSTDINSDAQVIVTIPAAIRTKENLPEFKLVITDEAHQFYETKKGGGMVQRILKETKAKYQLLLTGSPSIFNGKGIETFAVTINNLHDRGQCSDVIIEVATANYSVSNTDYNTNYDLKKEAGEKETQSDVNKAMYSILEKIQDRLESMHRLKPELYSWVDRNAGWLPALGQLKKTMIVCNNRTQSRKVYKYLLSKKVNCAISISGKDGDDNSSEIERFKDEENCMVLIVVGRGILGFNMPELENVVDMTGSTNIDRIMQLLCRVNRVHPNVKQKLFIKVAPINRVDYIHAVMHAVCCMFDREWFLGYNGKNFLDMPVAVKREKTKRGEGIGDRKPKKNKVKVIEFTGLPSIEFFKTLNHKRDDAFSGVEYTTVAEVRAILLNFNGMPNGYWTLELCKEESAKYSYIKDWRKESLASYQAAHKNGWIDECTAHMIEIQKPTGYWTFDRCKQSALKYNTIKEWRANDGTAYAKAAKNGWLDECTVHMQIIQRKAGYWNDKELCRKEALKYNNISDFITKSSAAYQSAKKNNWLEEITSHMISERKKNGYWHIFENVLNDAKKYKTFTEWNSKSGGAVANARKNGWLDKCTAHMKKRNQDWTLEICKKISLKYTKATLWRKENKSCYNAVCKNKWLNECTAHMKKTK